MATTKTKTVSLPKSGVKLFYREDGPLGSSTSSSTTRILLLLHGFPTSSHQFRNLIPLLSTRFRVIAPDFPGFGFTTPPPNFEYTFASLATVLAEFLDVLSITEFAMYIFDYGAPVGLRLALQRPQAVKAIISQNGNAYEEGLGEAWAPIRAFWKSDNTTEDRAGVANLMLTEEMTRFQYVNGTPNPEESIAPETYTLDYALLNRPGVKEAQVDLFFDYRNNVRMYPEFQAYFRRSQVPLLAVWGKGDVFFVPDGAEGYKRDLPGCRVRMLDAGHFAGESCCLVVAEEIVKFLG